MPHKDSHISQESTQDTRTKSAVARSASEKILTRTLSGALYAVITLVSIFVSPWVFALYTAAVAWLCASEFYRMARLLGRDPSEVLGLAAAVAFVFLPLMPAILGQILVSAFLLISGLFFVFSPRKNIADMAVTVVGALYTGFLLSSLVELRLMHHAGAEYHSFTSALLVFGVISSIWLADAAAYFFGSKFGKHKMFPHISPKKSWEGFVAGMVASVFVWCLMLIVGIEGIIWPLVIVGGVLVSVAGLIGDLFESRLKRACAIKDSGTLLPGHGGMLDRCDSIIFGAMIAAFILQVGGFV